LTRTDRSTGRLGLKGVPGCHNLNSVHGLIGGGRMGDMIAAAAIAAPHH
jgi:hypothetical protein